MGIYGVSPMLCSILGTLGAQARQLLRDECEASFCYGVCACLAANTSIQKWESPKFHFIQVPTLNEPTKRNTILKPQEDGWLYQVSLTIYLVGRLSPTSCLTRPFHVNPKHQVVESAWKQEGGQCLVGLRPGRPQTQRRFRQSRTKKRELSGCSMGGDRYKMV